MTHRFILVILLCLCRQGNAATLELVRKGTLSMPSLSDSRAVLTDVRDVPLARCILTATFLAPDDGNPSLNLRYYLQVGGASKLQINFERQTTGCRVEIEWSIICWATGVSGTALQKQKSVAITPTAPSKTFVIASHFGTSQTASVHSDTFLLAQLSPTGDAVDLSVDDGAVTLGAYSLQIVEYDDAVVEHVDFPIPATPEDFKVTVTLPQPQSTIALLSYRVHAAAAADGVLSASESASAFMSALVEADGSGVRVHRDAGTIVSGDARLQVIRFTDETRVWSDIRTLADAVALDRFAVTPSALPAQTVGIWPTVGISGVAAANHLRACAAAVQHDGTEWVLVRDVAQGQCAIGYVLIEFSMTDNPSAGSTEPAVTDATSTAGGTGTTGTAPSTTPNMSGGTSAPPSGTMGTGTVATNTNAGTMSASSDAAVTNTPNGAETTTALGVTMSADATTTNGSGDDIMSGTGADESGDVEFIVIVAALSFCVFLLVALCLLLLRHRRRRSADSEMLGRRRRSMGATARHTSRRNSVRLSNNHRYSVGHSVVSRRSDKLGSPLDTKAYMALPPPPPSLASSSSSKTNYTSLPSPPPSVTYSPLGGGGAYGAVPNETYHVVPGREKSYTVLPPEK